MKLDIEECADRLDRGGKGVGQATAGNGTDAIQIRQLEKRLQFLDKQVGETLENTLNEQTKTLEIALNE